MKEISLFRVRENAGKFVEDGCRAIIRKDQLIPEHFLLSPCPVSTALAVMSLLTGPDTYRSHIKKGLQYLETCRNPDGGWGRTPGSPSDEKSTQICFAAVNCRKSGLTSDAVRTAAKNIGTTWMQDVPGLILGWPADSPLTGIIEYFILNDNVTGIFADISFDHLPVVLAFLPPGGRPLITALSCIRHISRKTKARTIKPAVNRLVAYQSPNGAWCEDILITSLCILCLFMLPCLVWPHPGTGRFRPQLLTMRRSLARSPACC